MARAAPASLQQAFAAALDHHKAGRLAEAIAGYRALLAQRPDLPEVHFNLGVALGMQGKPDDAIAALRRATRLKPDYLAAHTNLGGALKEQGEFAASVDSYRRAVALRPDLPEAHFNLGNALKAQGRLGEAADSLRRAIALRPDYVDARMNLAITLLAAGDYPAGWLEFEWRWRPARNFPLLSGDLRDFSQPLWRGEAAEGKTLLLHAEQGFGDTLQFCRFATLARARGPRIVMEVQRPLQRLLRSLEGVDMVIARGDALPPFDLQCPMMTLPLALGVTLADLPAATAYLRPDPTAVAAWGKRLGPPGGARVGLVWAGNSYLHSPKQAAVDRRRSVPPDLLAPLMAVSGIEMFSLQKDGPAAPDSFRLIDMMAEMADFADTAALVANLDLVISVDSAMAHLAGAMGTPVWILNRHDQCWRWLANRDDSPWYPRARLYRQSSPGDWRAVIDAVGRDLRLAADSN